MSAVKMQEVNNTVDVFKDDIDMYINLWMEERSIEDMCKVSQNRWYKSGTCWPELQLPESKV